MEEKEMGKDEKMKEEVGEMKDFIENEEEEERRIRKEMREEL